AALLGDHVLLDAGPAVPGAVARAGRSLRDVHHVLVTHAHPDHLDPALLLWLSWNPTPHTLHIWGPPSVRLACKEWVGPHTPVEFHDIRPGDVVALDTPEGTWHARVHAAAHDAAPFGGSHDDIAADSVLLDITDTLGSRLLYLTDTGPLPDSTVAALTHADADLVLIEETFGDHLDHRTGHLDLATLPHALDALREVGAIAAIGQVVAVHLSHHNPPAEVLRARLADLGVRLLDDGEVAGRPRRTLLLGGARSGKSAEAERRARSFVDVVYAATAAPRPADSEWAERVAHHRARRPSSWTTVEGHASLADTLLGATPSQAVVVDCLTLWLTGVLDDAAQGADWDTIERSRLTAAAETASKDLIDALSACRATVLLVSNELGMGVVPMSASSRLFVDLLGRLHQQVGAVCDETVLMVAGRPLAIEGGRR
ncbi:MAG: bifunctional adenosylcobinamide kinase/adenosylcobinamide-phosphate guanylyltransferase, partial [Actinomycetota bacterium]